MTKKNTQAAIAWILACKLSFIMMMFQVKSSVTLSFIQLNFFRGVAILSASVLLILASKNRVFKTTKPWLQLLRSFCGAGGMLCFFYAYQKIDFSQASALNFSQSLWAMALAVLFLKEPFSYRHWISIMVGYVGVYLIINPDAMAIRWDEAIALLGALFLALENILAKKVVSKDSPALFMFYSSCVIVGILGLNYLSPIVQIPGITEWKSLTINDLQTVIIVATLSLISQYTYLRAYLLENVNFLAPFDYTKVIFSGVVEVFVLGIMPPWQTFLGSLMVLGGIVYLTRHRLSGHKKINAVPVD